MKIGIYCIENILNNKKYIGQSTNLEKRLREHRGLLRSGKNSAHLQKSWNFYKEENFIFYIVEECPKELLNEKEKYYINMYKTYDENFGYNLTTGAERECGFQHRESTKIKISETEKGKTISEETREKMSKSFSGRVETQQQKDKISKSLIGNKRACGKHSEEENYSKSLRMIGNKRNNSSSRYIGVYWVSRLNKWSSRFKIFKKSNFIGNFEHEIEAALAYNEYALEFLGWKAKLNIITKEEIEKLWMEE